MARLGHTIGLILGFISLAVAIPLYVLGLLDSTDGTCDGDRQTFLSIAAATGITYSVFMFLYHSYVICTGQAEFGVDQRISTNINDNEKLKLVDATGKLKDLNLADL